MAGIARKRYSGTDDESVIGVEDRVTIVMAAGGDTEFWGYRSMPWNSRLKSRSVG